ncbi:hypothetical protein [Brevundimonas sp.]|uniref:hypothetical protein n=1 Tax=Brevundimonas sp. TaxID=1871086 RepID=UPI0028A0E0E8|nr:hypothetical protein [Brevundimonas sp.]
MSFLKSTTCAATLLLATPAMAHSQSDDGWDTATSGDTQVAYAEYSSGQTIAIQCKDSDLQVAIIGLPVVENPQADTTGSRFTVLDSASGHPLVHIEVNKDRAPTTGIAIMPARFARALKNGNPVTIKAIGQPEITLALPTDGSAVEKLLSDCGTPLSDPNDQRIIRGLPTMDVLNRAQRRFARNAPTGTYTITTQCTVVADRKLQDCQSVRQIPSAPDYERIFSGSLNGYSVKPDEAATAQLREGELVIFNYTSTTTHEIQPL